MTIVLVAASSLCGAPAARAQADVITSSREKLAVEFNEPSTALPQIFVQDAYTP